MSRNTEIINENITFHWGTDDALGNWFDVCDKRFTNSGNDEQGEGYVLEYCSEFKFTNNLLGLSESDVPFSKERIVEACNELAKTNYEACKRTTNNEG